MTANQNTIQQPTILQERPIARPWSGPMTSRLPGLTPLDGAPWLMRDPAYNAQMALRDRLFAEAPETCLAAPEATLDLQRDLLQYVVTALSGDLGYGFGPRSAVRPDGVYVSLDDEAPLVSAARLVQADLMLLAPDDPGHTLVAGALAFPSSWSLREKMNRPLASIHAPVARIDGPMQTRIDRVIGRLVPGQPLQRANMLAYNDPALHQPRTEAERKSFDAAKEIFIRVERQCLLRLPRSGAGVFSIQTSVTPLKELSSADRTMLAPVIEATHRAAQGLAPDPERMAGPEQMAGPERTAEPAVQAFAP
ncbi:MAG: DUF3445 domain-containing protein [Hyphomonadaceae bacterium]